MHPELSPETEGTSVIQQARPDYSWDGPGVPDFSGHSQHDKNAKKPGFLQYLASLHSEALEYNIEGLAPYTGTRQQVMLNIDYRGTKLPRRMCSLDTAYYSDRPWQVTNVKQVTGNVYRGTMHVHGGQVVEVALKFGFGYDAKDELVREVIFYTEELEDLQGKVVPQYLGTFCSTHSRKNYDTPLVKTCVVFTWVGHPLLSSVKDLEDAHLR
jgi:hypothetical protein